MGAVGYAGFYGYKHGDVNRLTAPIDGDFRFCGSDEHVKEFQKLYITDLSFHSNIMDIFATGVCVRTCPDKDVVLQAADFGATEKYTDATITGQYSTTSVMDFCLPDDVSSLNENIQKGLEALLTQLKETPGASYIEDI